MAPESRRVLEFDADVTVALCRRFLELAPAHDRGECIRVVALQDEPINISQVALLMQEFDDLVNAEQLST